MTESGITSAALGGSAAELAIRASLIFAEPTEAQLARRLQIIRRRRLRRAILFGFFDFWGIVGGIFVFAFPLVVFGSLVVILVQHG